MTPEASSRLRLVRAVRAELHSVGPKRTRPFTNDFANVALPAADCDALRDLLVAEQARSAIEIGLGYGCSALAIGEALCSTDRADVSHVVIDPFQASAYDNVGLEALEAAGLMVHTTFFAEPSSSVLPRVLDVEFTADAAFVDGSHRFHEVFLDLYFLRKLVRPGGLVILDDVEWPSVGAALRYFDLNLGWQPVSIEGRLTARRLPEPFEPGFTDFVPFCSSHS